MENFWDKRFAQKEYVYGTKPNQFFAQEIESLSDKGKLLLPAEGEGRNALYAAKKGWQVTAFDSSSKGREKALHLAEKNKVDIDYRLCEFEEYPFPKNCFDAVALIYAHLPATLRTEIHRKTVQSLKTGGVLILEAFNKQQLGKESGGPKDLKMLYDENMLKSDFANLKIIKNVEVETELSEGDYHKGHAEVIRFVGIKT